VQESLSQRHIGPINYGRADSLLTFIRFNYNRFETGPGGRTERMLRIVALSSRKVEKEKFSKTPPQFIFRQLERATDLSDGFAYEPTFFASP
jgi:hypothetical protein